MHRSTSVIMVFAAALALGATACQQRPKAASAELSRTAFDAAVWGTPIVSVDAMRQAFFRDGGAKYGDIVYWSKPSDWRNQITTPNASTHYVYFNFNTKDGPVVIDVPPAVGAGLFGSMLDAWQVPMADVGPQGDDQGKGGKYVLLPPGFVGEPPAGYFPVRFRTVNGYCAFRSIPEGSSDAAVARANALVRRLRTYPLAQASAPPPTAFHDMSDKVFDAIMRYDETFYASLARMMDEEPAMPRDSVMIRRLATLGIEKGKPFAPDTAMQALLARAARSARDTLMTVVANEGEAYWPDHQWRTPSVVGAHSGFTFVVNDKLDVLSRGATYFLACAPPKNIGKASFYLCGYVDRAGQPLRGDRSYRLHVPAGVPAAQFWAVTAYDRETAAFIRDSPRVELNSYARGTAKNADGSVDVYFGPQPPAGKESNWVFTAPGGAWFALFRFYGPGQALFEKSWVLPDIEEVQ